MTLGDWQSLQQFSWIEALRDCPQDPVHHAEGNVWIHTRMVLEELARDSRFGSAAADDRNVLWAAAVLHDVAKPETTEILPDGSVTAKGHSARGALRARRIVWELGMPFAQREEVCGLIRYHQLPFYLIEREDAQRMAAAIALVARWRLLAVLAEADIRGRICEDLPRVLENIALFSEFCREEVREFPSPLARFEYFRREDRAIDYASHPSFAWAKALQARIGGQIEPGVTLFGEYCYAVHSIVYEELPGYFFLFGVRDDDSGAWWEWDLVTAQAGLLELPAVPELFRGVVESEGALERLVRGVGAGASVFGGEREGVVARVTRVFDDSEFAAVLGKYVRADHVQTDEHWMFQELRVQRGPRG